jgi:aspartyl protease family protein
MRLVLPLMVLAIAAAFLMLAPPEATPGGFSRTTLGAGAGLAALLLYYLASLRPSDVARLTSSLAVWALALALIVGAYAYRFEASGFIGQMTAELMPSEPTIGEGGEAIVRSRLGGQFAVSAHVNGTRTTLMFDTGASMVVLTANDARRAGIDTKDLVYDVPVTTANGQALAAETRLDEISVGEIVMRRVPALVAKPGALEESLLGMSFLSRLKSYSVERGRLVLTGR